MLNNVHISNLSSQILELILDNIRVIHLNAKLTQYLKQLTIESNMLKQEKPTTVEAPPEQVEQLQNKVSTH